MSKNAYPQFQAASSEQGEMFHSQCLVALKYAGFDIEKSRYRVASVGIEVDIVASNKHGITMFFECKGSIRKSGNDRPGLERTDSIKKAIANAYLFSLSDEYETCSPLIILASHLSSDGAGIAMLNAVPRNVILDVINPNEHGDRLQWLAGADSDDLESDMETYPLEMRLRLAWQKNSLPRSCKERILRNDGASRTNKVKANAGRD